MEPAIQQRLFESFRLRNLPASRPDVYAFGRAAGEFTGDFYFTHRYADRLWFVLGDVAGKGLKAAVIMAMIQEELEHRITACAMTACEPEVTITRLHAFLRPLLPSNRFATAVLGQLYDDGSLCLVNAGHCSPLIVRRSGEIEEFPSTGPVLGMFPAARWSTHRTRLEKGETVVLFTDGVIEARSTEDEFGINGAREAILGSFSRSPQDIAESLIRAVDRHAGGKRDDDLTVLVVRR